MLGVKLKLYIGTKKIKTQHILVLVYVIIIHLFQYLIN